MGAEDQPGQPPSVGEARKAVQTGQLPIGSVQDILKRAPSDLVEAVLEIPEWECSVKVKSFTGAQSASIKEAGFVPDPETGMSRIDWAEMEINQFQKGVIEPRFDIEQVRELYLSSGIGFARVISWLDEKSTKNRKEIEKTTEEFRGSSESS